MVLCSTSNLTWSKDVTAVDIMQISKKAWNLSETSCTRPFKWQWNKRRGRRNSFPIYSHKVYFKAERLEVAGRFPAYTERLMTLDINGEVGGVIPQECWVSRRVGTRWFVVLVRHCHCKQISGQEWLTNQMAEFKPVYNLIPSGLEMLGSLFSLPLDHYCKWTKQQRVGCQENATETR